MFGVEAGDGGGVGEDVVGAVGDGWGEAGAGEGGAGEVALGLILGGHVCVEAGRELEEAGGCSVLKRGGGADVGEVVEVANGGEPFGAAGEIAETPAGDGESLGEAGDGDSAVGHAGQCGDGDVLSALVEEVLVHLVGENDEVVLNGEVREQL